jgi:hypothetical protein
MKTLECACCGRSFKGWQYWNRDTGFGICKGCSDGYGYHTEGEKPDKEAIEEIRRREREMGG